MKTKVIFLSLATLTLLVTSLLFITGCQKEGVLLTTSNPSSETTVAGNVEKNGNHSLIFNSKAHMYGKSYAEWIQEWWKWVLSFDCSHTPLKDIDGTRENQNQSGNVYFLAGRRGNTLNVVIPANVSLYFPLVTFYAEDPCIDNGTIPPGESLDHFLTGIVRTNVNAIDGLSLTIDGKAIDDLDDYKLISKMYSYSANADLASCYDGCITGSQQSFVDGGYFVMLKPLSPGNHVIHRNGGASSLFPFTFDITYNITQL